MDARERGELPVMRTTKWGAAAALAAVMAVPLAGAGYAQAKASPGVFRTGLPPVAAARLSGALAPPSARRVEAGYWNSWPWYRRRGCCGGYGGWGGWGSGCCGGWRGWGGWGYGGGCSWGCGWGGWPSWGGCCASYYPGYYGDYYGPYYDNPYY